VIRRLKSFDREALESILKRTKQFKAEEVNVALELIDIALNFPAQTDYHIFVYEDQEKVLGYHCTGRRPMTDAVYDMYWIVVDPDTSGKGVGKKLLQHATEFVKELNGRWLLAETSSKETYEKTKLFYMNNNFKVIAQIDDFYSEGDSLLVFGKRL
jgi:aminoglycoside 6'-N-acetyltransferase I